MWRALVGGLSLVWLFSCSSSSKNTDTVCNPKITQACSKAGCVGVQQCLDDGSDWGPCDCGGTGGSSTGGSAGSASGGTSSGGTSSGGTSSGGTSSGGSAGAATGGVAGASGGSGGAVGACSGFSSCGDTLTCCVDADAAGMLKLKNLFGANCDTLSPKTAQCTQACNNGTPSDEITVLAACLQSLTARWGGYKTTILGECGCEPFLACIAECT